MLRLNRMTVTGFTFFMMPLFLMLVYPGILQSQSWPVVRGLRDEANAQFLGSQGYYDSSIWVTHYDYPEDSVVMSFEVADGNTTYQGWGHIPQEAFKIVGQSGTAYVEIDTSTLPDFTVTRCVYYGYDSYECAPHPGGLVRMEWTCNGAWRDINRMYLQRFSNQYNGPATQSMTYVWQSAGARGVILGYERKTPPEEEQAASITFKDREMDKYVK